MKKIDWVTLGYIGSYHLCLALFLPLYLYFHSPSLFLIFSMLGLVFACGIGITAGYHRCFSHPTYKAHPIIEAILLFFGNLATQGSALRWAYEHRMHHAHVDSDEDPYSITKGFWHAHMLWLFRLRPAIDDKVVADLKRNSMLVFQHKYYVGLLIVQQVLTVLFFGWVSADLFGAFVFCYLLRSFLTHHTTWFINSLAHSWGEQNFSKEHSAVDNFIISLLTYGEGYHNYHHTFANDYRNGIKWYHYDPTKWLIFLFSKVGLAYNLRRMNNDKIQFQLILEHKKELLKNLKQSLNESREDLIERVHKQADALTKTLEDFIQKGNRYKELGKDLKEIKNHLKQEIRALKSRLKFEWRNWDNLSDYIHKLKKLA
ncbi:MAG: acyl-CoA desaturase [Chlamydiae bacterium]|jgi:stearoyl-CoA desaturase (delta-9 desaturase)|nr:acyl-CoA desaturase [Chlamydiota bacterium]